MLKDIAPTLLTISHWNRRRFLLGLYVRHDANCQHFGERCCDFEHFGFFLLSHNCLEYIDLLFVDSAGMENAFFVWRIGLILRKLVRGDASMKTSGIKMLDPALGSVQVDWLVVPAKECRDFTSEEQYVRRHFRKPHEPWGHHGAFVMPVRIRRNHSRVLFFQESGVYS